MNTPSRTEFALCASLALAAHYFPETTPEGGAPAGPFDRAAYLLSGQFQAWPQWEKLTSEERRRIVDVFANAPGGLADPRRFFSAARAMLASLAEEPPGQAQQLRTFNAAGGDPFTARAAVPHVGDDLLSYVDRQLQPFRRPSARPKPPEFAGPGTWSTGEIYVSQSGRVHGRTTIPTYPGYTEPFGHESLPRAETAEPLEELPIPTRELLYLAERIESRRPEDQRYLRTTLNELLDALNTSDSISPQEALRMAAGGLEIFHAPTGTGKSILVRVVAAWMAQQGHRVAIVLPDIKACLKTTREIQADLRILRELGDIEHETGCAHLMSSSGMQERALKLSRLISEDPDDPGEWGEHGDRDIDPLAYGCAQRPLMESSAPYPPGREPCMSLHRQGVGAAACPWIPTCGKFAPVYEACSAHVVVTNHFAFLKGNLGIGLNLDGRPVRGVSVAEFTLRTCHAVFVDEVDQFQSRAVDCCAGEVVLHSRRHWTSAPQEMDTDAKRLSIAEEAELLTAIGQVRLMAEFLLLAVSRNALSLEAIDDARVRERVPDRTGVRWHLARGRDRQLARLLWPNEEEAAGETDLPSDIAARLQRFMPVRYGDEPAATANDERAVSRALEALVAPRGESVLNEVKIRLHELLAPRISDPQRRAQTVHLLMARAIMGELDEALSHLRTRAQQHRPTGLRSAQRISETLSRSAVTDTLPLGLLGRSLTGYRVTGLEDRERSATLVAQSLAGDPHTFTAELGGLVALSLAGAERPVMGLSATAFFPQAVREHVAAPVRWWMTDAQARSILARRHRIDYGEGHPLFGEPIKISGQHPSRKKNASIELGTQLYDRHIHGELQRQRAKDPDRAHVLVVANSYEQCAWLARGISQAGNYREGLCVAVRDGDTDHTDLPRENIAARLTAEQFEDFPQHGSILVVPLALIARGLNIVVGTRSAVRSIYLCVRPLSLFTDPAQMYASVNAAGMAALAKAKANSMDPGDALQQARNAAQVRLDLILRASPQFTAMPHVLQEEVVAGVIVDLIQLAGRARRGGTEAILHLVDYAFHEDTWSSDLETILGRISEQWTSEVREQMNGLYGQALDAFLSYAGLA
ncbi:DEAD/DEAH box helicase family protein [Allosalinactinospora lopnorensis]|uniref:hypothetical protein n=1 Tax=Allosalinactinospora lopnorensis TaxID=1352348 RepID=UPI000623F35B|nr:hypothetical protein [Allosalinactinospora lopnorensis]